MGATDEAQRFTSAERWKLKKAVEKILEDAGAGVRPFRVGICHKVKGRGVDRVRVLREPGTPRVFFGGLMRCASVWVCPVCAAKITERRREELAKANLTWVNRGGRIYLLTLTAPHHLGDDLAKLLQAFRDARRVMMNRKGWRRFKDAAAVVGTVCALEVTHGKNGWHVHTHELVYCDAEGKEPAAADLLPLWQSGCAAADLDTPNEHGVNVENGARAAQYVSKFGAVDSDEDGWNVAHEMTKAHVKKGKTGGRSPWDLLRAVAYTDDADAAKLFREYAICFRGRRQLVWSRGLRDLLGIGPAASDEELANEERDDAETVYTFDDQEWADIVRRELQGEVLSAAREHGAAGIYRLLYAGSRGSPIHDPGGGA